MTGTRTIAALLLASGRGSRFDPSGAKNKLLERLPDGRTVIAASVQTLLDAGLPVTVVAPDDGRIGAALGGLAVSWCANAEPMRGMGASLAQGVAATSHADGWLVALADMPFVRAETVIAVSRAVLSGAQLAAPFVGESRGHPVGFSADMRHDLLALDGDHGARALLERYPVMRIECDDYGILRDIDRPQDLHR